MEMETADEERSLLHLHSPHVFSSLHLSSYYVFMAASYEGERKEYDPSLIEDIVLFSVGMNKALSMTYIKDGPSLMSHKK